MIVAGLTGGIASGKSTVSAFFRQFGAFIIDADLIAHDVVAPERPAWQSIRETFGDQMLMDDGTIDRVRLARAVFNDAALRKQLECIVHPHVKAQMETEVMQLRQTTPDAVVIQDVPLLLESDMTRGLAEIIVVYVPETIQLQRLMQRDGILRDAARARITAQMPMAEKKRRATIVIDNGGSLAFTRKQTRKVYRDLARQAVSS